MARGDLSVDEVTGAEWQVALYASDREIPAHAAGYGVGVRLDQLQLLHPRRWGDCWLALQLWNELGLDSFWQERLAPSREETDCTRSCRC